MTRVFSTATATAAVCLAAYLLGFAHMALVRHATCPEHDEIIHQATPRTVSPGADSSLESRLDVADPDDRDNDDHCLAVAVQRRNSIPSRTNATMPSPPPVARDQLSHRRDAALRRSVAVIRIAPKNSPPCASV